MIDKDIYYTYILYIQYNQTLPLPDGPTNAVTDPASIVSDKFAKIVVSGCAGYAKEMF